MDHEASVRIQAASRYVAGELSPEERDAFEEHFFVCLECAEEVRWEQIFVANARLALREKSAPSGGVRAARARLAVDPRLALSLAANAVLLIGLGYGLLSNQSPAPGTAPQFYLSFFARPPAQAEGSIQAIPADARFFGIRFLVPGGPSSSYCFEVLNEEGGRELSGSLAAPSASVSELYLQVPTQPFRNGVHTLLIRGSGRTGVVARFQFRI